MSPINFKLGKSIQSLKQNLWYYGVLGSWGVKSMIIVLVKIWFFGIHTFLSISKLFCRYIQGWYSSDLNRNSDFFIFLARHSIFPPHFYPIVLFSYYLSKYLSDSIILAQKIAVDRAARTWTYWLVHHSIGNILSSTHTCVFVRVVYDFRVWAPCTCTKLSQYKRAHVFVHTRFYALLLRWYRNYLISTYRVGVWSRKDRVCEWLWWVHIMIFSLRMHRNM